MTAASLGPARPTRPGPRARVGVFGIGLAAYWPQFDGPEGAHRGLPAARRGARRASWAARSCPPGWSTPRRARARPATASRPRRSTSCSATRSPTPPRAPCCRWRRRRGSPVVLLGLQPAATLDYAHTDTGEWLANCAACCVPEIAGAFTRAGIPYDTVAGTIDDDERAWAKIGAWVRAAGRRARPAARADRLPRARLSGHARHVHRLHRGARPGRRARRGARDRRPRRARGRGERRRGRGQEGRDPRRCSRSPTRPADPIAGPIEPEQLDWSARVAVGLDRLVADFELDALTYYYRGARRQRGRAARRRRDRRQLAADRARRPDRRRGRPQDEPRAADPRPARRRRLLHRVLRARLRRGLRADGPRRARAHRDRAGAADAARAQALPRQARRRPERRVQGPLRPGHDRRLHADAPTAGSS